MLPQNDLLLATWDPTVHHANESRAICLALVSGGLPEVRGARVVVGHDRGEPDGALLAQATLPRPQQRHGDPLSSPVAVYGEPIEAAAPSIPGRDQRADDDAVRLGDQQRVAVGAKQARDAR